MKHLFAILCIALCALSSVQAQKAPEGMKYQAVARNDAGEILALKSIELKISLYNPTNIQAAGYAEYHSVTTNEYGLFSITVGEGKSDMGSFEMIPWSTADIYMAVEIFDEKSSSFVTVSDNRLLTVPYAFHASTASALTNGETGRNVLPNWATSGNLAAGPKTPVLGTLDCEDLVIITNGNHKMIIDCKGNVSVLHSMTIEENFSVNGHTSIGGPVDLSGVVQIRDTLKVVGMAPTILTGSLLVEKNLTVNGKTELNDSMTVNSATELNDALTVNSTTELNDALTVNSTTALNDAVTVNGKFNVVHNDGGFVASLENTNDGEGDGLVIKLGKTHPRHNGSEVRVDIPGLGVYNTAISSTKTLVKDLIVSGGASFSAESFEQIGLDMLEAFENAIPIGSLADAASTACMATNDVIDDINTTLNLPYSFPAITVPSIYIPEDFIAPELPPDRIRLKGPTPLIPAIPNLFPAIPHIPCELLEADVIGWQLPNFSLEDVDQSLTNKNEYLSFTDAGDRQLGSVRAESIEDWCDRHLSPTYFLNLFNSFAGVTVVGIDPSQLAETIVKYGINGLAQISTLSDAYNSIGVEYSSGYGDYAEWLERRDINEEIRPGDIVGVVGGKISKDLTNAEQVMAISSKPIVLGNSPVADREHMGNKVAFMGQIPVKVIGQVSTGDFIVGKGEIPGYGVAIHPEDMTVDDFALAVGRSWDNLESDGAKMVNTVIGVHNGNNLNILKKYQERLDETDARLNSLEARLNSYFPAPVSND